MNDFYTDLDAATQKLSKAQRSVIRYTYDVSKFNFYIGNLNTIIDINKLILQPGAVLITDLFYDIKILERMEFTELKNGLIDSSNSSILTNFNLENLNKTWKLADTALE